MDSILKTIENDLKKKLPPKANKFMTIIMDSIQKTIHKYDMIVEEAAKKLYNQKEKKCKKSKT